MPEIRRRKILFVDDEPKILQGLQRMLHPMRKQWEMRFAESGAEALSLFQGEPFDVVVTDMRMPGMDGAQLLSEIKRQAPEVIRIVLSGYSDRQMVLKSIPLAHQFLSKPCQPQTLISALSGAIALGDLLSDPCLRRLVAQISALPSLPALYLEMEQAIQSQDGSVDRIAEIISRDVGMTAKVLQLANSAYFGLPQTVNSPKEAVFHIGLKALEPLVLVVHIFAQFRNASHFRRFLDELLLHSQATAGIAEGICKREGGDRAMGGHASLAGMLHDCGKLILADNFPEEYERALALSGQERMPLWQAEERVFGVHHGSIGAYLLGTWGIPDPIIKALAFHHHPGSCPQDRFTVLTAVHAADALEPGNKTVGERAGLLDEGYLSAAGLRDRLPEWQALAQAVTGRQATD